MDGVPGSRFRAAARSSARSAMDGAEESVGWAASRRALRRDAVTGVEVERGRLAYATVGGGCVEAGEETSTATEASGEAGEARWELDGTAAG